MVSSIRTLILFTRCTSNVCQVLSCRLRSKNFRRDRPEASKVWMVLVDMARFLL